MSSASTPESSVSSNVRTAFGRSVPHELLDLGRHQRACHNAVPGSRRWHFLEQPCLRLGSARRAGQHRRIRDCPLRWPFDMSEARSLNGVAASIADFGSAFRRGLFCHHSVDQLKSEIRSGASVKKVREAFQDPLSIAGFPPSSPPLLEMSGSDFRNVRVQGSISISSFDCTSALRAVDFNFDTRMDRCQAEMQSNSRFQFQLLKRPLSHRNAIETSISISALDFRSE